MKTPLQHLIFWIALPGMLWAQGAGSDEVPEKIKISAPEGRVIPIVQRESALRIGQQLLNNRGEDLEEKLVSMHTPFIFKEPKVEDTQDEEDTDQDSVITGAPRGDLEVLRVLAPRLQREVQGSMILGNRKRLIWSNGNSVEIGFTFQTRISENDPNLYQITISDIQEKSFSIQMNDAELLIPIGSTSSGNNSIRSDN